MLTITWLHMEKKIRWGTTVFLSNRTHISRYIYFLQKKTFGQKGQRDPQSTDESNIESKHPKNQLPQAPYVLNQDERCQADKRLKLVKVPANFGIIPGTLFTKIIGGTKCHTWLQLFSTGIVRYCIRGMLSRECRA